MAAIPNVYQKYKKFTIAEFEAGFEQAMIDGYVIQHFQVYNGDVYLIYSTPEDGQ
jgi:hypothetical protein